MAAGPGRCAAARAIRIGHVGSCTTDDELGTFLKCWHDAVARLCNAHKGWRIVEVDADHLMLSRGCYLQWLVGSPGEFALASVLLVVVATPLSSTGTMVKLSV